MSHSQSCKEKKMKRKNRANTNTLQCPLDSCMYERVGPSHHSKKLLIITVSGTLGNEKKNGEHGNFNKKKS